MNIIIATIGIISQLVIVLVTIQSRKTRVRNVALNDRNGMTYGKKE